MVNHSLKPLESHIIRKRRIWFLFSADVDVRTRETTQTSDLQRSSGNDHMCVNNITHCTSHRNNVNINTISINSTVFAQITQNIFKARGSGSKHFNRSSKILQMWGGKKCFIVIVVIKHVGSNINFHKMWGVCVYLICMPINFHCFTGNCFLATWLSVMPWQQHQVWHLPHFLLSPQLLCNITSFPKSMRHTAASAAFK